MARVVLITGATGKQGGAVINSLLEARADFNILAVTRNPDSPGAQRLLGKSPKVKIIQGDLDDADGLFANAKKAVSGPIWGVYSVQNPMASGQTIAKEIQQGKDLIDRSIKNGVKHFVYSSVDRGGKKSLDSPTPVPHFASKHEVERHLLEKTSRGEMDWTILRPTGFMDNYTPGFQAKVFLTAWKVAIDNHRPLQLIAVSDIGYFAAQALMHPEKYRKLALSLAGDELTFNQAAEIFKQKTGKAIPTTFGFIASLVLHGVKEVGLMFKWMNDEGFGANIEELRKQHPALVDFGTYLKTQSGYVVSS